MLNITCDVKLHIEQARNNQVTSCADTELSRASDISKTRLNPQREFVCDSCLLLMSLCMGKYMPVAVHCVCVCGGGGCVLIQYIHTHIHRFIKCPLPAWICLQS